MPAIELTESVSGAPTTLALRKNSADSPSLLERGGVRSGGSASVASSVFNLANTIMGTAEEAGARRCRCWPPAFVDAPIEIAVAALFLLLTTSIALGVRDLGVIVGLVGASAGNLISFIVPAGSYFFLMPHEKWSAKRVGALVTLVAGIVLLPTCVAMVFIDT